MSEIRYKDLIPYYYLYPLFLVLATLFLLVFSAATSPLYPAYGSDSSMFLTMGRLLLEGKVPYVDFFDHKGPFLILIEAIGQLFIRNKIGVFILQIVNLFIAQILVYRIARLFLNTLNSLVTTLIFLVFFSLTIDGGNMTEEYCLIPLMATLYITIRNYISNQEISISNALTIGFCFAFIFWIRPNNAGLISACVAFMFIISIMNKDGKSLKNLVLFFILVQLIIAFFVFAYFLYHKGIEDLLYANFTFNFKYIGTEEISYKPLYLKLNIIAVATLLVGGISYCIKNKDYRLIILLAAILIFNIVITNIGNGYIHYLTLLLPAILLGYLLFISSLGSFANNKTFGITILILVIAAMGFRISQTYSPSGWVEVEHWVDNYKKDGMNIMNQIPEKEHIRTYYYSIDPRFYQIMDLTPNYKYFVVQDFHSSFDPNIAEEIDALLCSNNHPLWIVTQTKQLSDFSSSSFRSILTTNYRPYSENDTFVLYKAID